MLGGALGADLGSAGINPAGIGCNRRGDVAQQWNISSKTNENSLSDGAVNNRNSSCHS